MAILTLGACSQAKQQSETKPAAAAMPDLQGIWQTMNAANVNILAHSAGPDGPAGQSVVEGGVLPYQDWAVKKREDTHKMAEANRAFSHYRW